MTIDGNTPMTPAPPAPAERRARTPGEAARQFEAVLVRQFVDAMTDGLFEAGLSGEEGPGWMSGQHDVQRDALAGVLTEHLVERGVFKIADLLLRQWRREGLKADDEAPALEAPPPLRGPVTKNRETL